eukprot:1159522-Pelagomonas_calceolata.AAC.4
MFSGNDAPAAPWANTASTLDHGHQQYQQCKPLTSTASAAMYRTPILFLQGCQKGTNTSMLCVVLPVFAALVQFCGNLVCNYVWPASFPKSATHCPPCTQADGL